MVTFSDRGSSVHISSTCQRQDKARASSTKKETDKTKERERGHKERTRRDGEAER